MDVLQQLACCRGRHSNYATTAHVNTKSQLYALLTKPIGKKKHVSTTKCKHAAKKLCSLIKPEKTENPSKIDSPSVKSDKDDNRLYLLIDKKSFKKQLTTKSTHSKGIVSVLKAEQLENLEIAKSKHPEETDEHYEAKKLRHLETAKSTHCEQIGLIVETKKLRNMETANLSLSEKTENLGVETEKLQNPETAQSTHLEQIESKEVHTIQISSTFCVAEATLGESDISNIGQCLEGGYHVKNETDSSGNGDVALSTAEYIFVKKANKRVPSMNVVVAQYALRNLNLNNNNDSRVKVERKSRFRVSFRSSSRSANYIRDHRGKFASSKNLNSSITAKIIKRNEQIKQNNAANVPIDNKARRSLRRKAFANSPSELGSVKRSRRSEPINYRLLSGLPLRTLPTQSENRRKSSVTRDLLNISVLNVASQAGNSEASTSVQLDNVLNRSGAIRYLALTDFALQDQTDNLDNLEPLFQEQPSCDLDMVIISNNFAQSNETQIEASKTVTGSNFSAAVTCASQTNAALEEEAKGSVISTPTNQPDTVLQDHTNCSGKFAACDYSVKRDETRTNVGENIGSICSEREDLSSRSLGQKESYNDGLITVADVEMCTVSTGAVHDNTVQRKQSQGFDIDNTSDKDLIDNLIKKCLDCHHTKDIIPTEKDTKCENSFKSSSLLEVTYDLSAAINSFVEESSIDNAVQRKKSEKSDISNNGQNQNLQIVPTEKNQECKDYLESNSLAEAPNCMSAAENSFVEESKAIASTNKVQCNTESLLETQDSCMQADSVELQKDNSLNCEDVCSKLAINDHTMPDVYGTLLSHNNDSGLSGKSEDESILQDEQGQMFDQSVDCCPPLDNSIEKSCFPENDLSINTQSHHGAKMADTKDVVEKDAHLTIEGSQAVWISDIAQRPTTDCAEQSINHDVDLFVSSTYSQLSVGVVKSSTFDYLAVSGVTETETSPSGTSIPDLNNKSEICVNSSCSVPCNTAVSKDVSSGSCMLETGRAQENGTDNCAAAKTYLPLCISSSAEPLIADDRPEVDTIDGINFLAFDSEEAIRKFVFGDDSAKFPKSASLGDNDIRRFVNKEKTSTEQKPGYFSLFCTKQKSNFQKNFPKLLDVHIKNGLFKVFGESHLERYGIAINRSKQSNVGTAKCQAKFGNRAKICTFPTKTNRLTVSGSTQLPKPKLSFDPKNAVDSFGLVEIDYWTAVYATSALQLPMASAPKAKMCCRKPGTVLILPTV